jgi:hypothetical protein
MSKSLPFPDSVKAELRRIAAAGHYVLATEILERGADDELLLSSLEEAQVIVNVARVQMMVTSLRFPFWDEDDPRHDPKHEEAFHEVVLGLFEKTVSIIGQDFEVKTAI